MIGAIIGGAIALGSAVASGVMSSKARKKQERALQQEKTDNAYSYARRMSEDPTQRADAQLMLSRVRDQVRKSSKAAEGRQAVTGGTDAAGAVQREANAQAMANAVGEIAARGEARKDAAEDQYLNRKANIDARQAQLDEDKANQMAQAVQVAGQTAGNIAGAVGGGNGGTSGAGKDTTPKVGDLSGLNKWADGQMVRVKKNLFG